ncbi:MAG: PAS domain-containing protein [Sphingomonas sp.]|nr:PAS domain-containing protein [Sphingomonas sp.]
MIPALGSQVAGRTETENRLSNELAAMAALRRVSSELASGENPQPLYDKLLETAMHLMHSQAASLQVLQDGRLRLTASRGFAEESADHWRWIDADSRTACERAMAARDRFLIPDVEADPEIAGTGDLDAYRKSGLRSVQSTPLIARDGHLLGMISTHWSEPHEPAADDYKHFDVLVRQIADFIERGEATKRLRESEQQYQSLFEASPVPFMVLAPNQPDFTILAANKAYFAATLRTPETLIGLRLFDVFSDDPTRPGQLGSEALAISLEKVLKTKRTDVMERVRYDIVNPRGEFEPHWWEAINAPMLDESGNITAIIHQVHRVTELHLAQEAERERQDSQAFLLKFSAALRAEPDADAVANRAIAMLLDRLQLDRSYITFYRPAEDEAVIPYQIGNESVPPLPSKVRLSDFPEAYEQVLERTFVIDDDFERLGVSDSERANSKALGMRAMVASTTRRGAKDPICSMVAVSSRPHHWTPGQIALVEEAAERTWAFMERARAEAALRDSERHAQTLLAELQHRVRNTLAVVRSIARRTAENSSSAEDLLAHFQGRLDAFSRVQAAVTRSAGGKVDLASLIEDELIAHAAHTDGQVRISGPAVALDPRAAERMSLAVHELTTNAVKHGALINDRGQISVSWKRTNGGGELFFSWIEKGVDVDLERVRGDGFGMELLRASLPYDLQAQTTVDLQPTGLRFELTMPLPSAT